jgi:N-acetylneuraminic acid mutarotase
MLSHINSLEEDNSWTHLDEYNEATNRRGHSAIVYNNKMIVFGGAADSQSVNTVYQWHLGKLHNFMIVKTKFSFRTQEMEENRSLWTGA